MTTPHTIIIRLPVNNPNAVADALVAGMDEDTEWAFWDDALLACGGNEQSVASGGIEFQRSRDGSASVTCYGIDRCVIDDNAKALAWCREHLPQFFAA